MLTIAGTDDASLGVVVTGTFRDTLGLCLVVFPTAIEFEDAPLD